MPELERLRDVRVGQGGVALVDVGLDLVLADRRRHRPAQRCVVERRAPLVRGKEPEAHDDRRDHRQALGRVDGLLEQLGITRIFGQEVDLSTREAAERRRDVRHVAQNPSPHLRRLEMRRVGFQDDLLRPRPVHELEGAGADRGLFLVFLGVDPLRLEVGEDRLPNMPWNQVHLCQAGSLERREGRGQLELDLVVADRRHRGNGGDERLVHRRHLARRCLEAEDDIVDRHGLAIVPGHPRPQRDEHGRVVLPLDLLGREGLREALGVDAHQAIPDQLGDPGVGPAGDVERVDRLHHGLGVEDHVLLLAEWRGSDEGPEVLDPEALGLNDRGRVPDGAAVGVVFVRVDEEDVGLVVGDDLLELVENFLALFAVHLDPLRLGQLVVLGIVVADEVVALLDRAGVEEVVDELVRIEPLGPADHLPGGHVPLLSVEPDEVAHLLPRHHLDLQVEADLLKLTRGELDPLELLWHVRLRLHGERELAHPARVLLRRGRCARRNRANRPRDDEGPS